MTDQPRPQPLFPDDIDVLTTVIKPDNPLVIKAGFGEPLQLTFDLPDREESSGSVKVTMELTLPDDMGTITASHIIEEEETDGLYRVARAAVLNRVRQEDEQYWDDYNRAKELAELPKAGRLNDVPLPEPAPEPLVLEHQPSKKVLDYRWFDPDGASPRVVHGVRGYNREWTPDSKERKNPDWLSIPCVKVHLSTCRRAKGYLVPKNSWSSPPKNEKLDGFRGAWGDLTPEIRIGVLVPELCTICKPFGTYTGRFNDHLAAAYPSTRPPEEMPGAFPSVHGGLTLSPRMKQGLWQQLVAMDLRKWEALADLAEWAAKETQDTPDAEYPVTHHA